LSFQNDAFFHYLILIFLSGILGYLGLTLGGSKAEEIGRLANSAMIPPLFQEHFPLFTGYQCHQ
jgi:uncharacterized protein YacL